MQQQSSAPAAAVTPHLPPPTAVKPSYATAVSPDTTRQYREGRKHGNADGLSCRPDPDSSDGCTDDDEDDLIRRDDATSCSSVRLSPPILLHRERYSLETSDIHFTSHFMRCQLVNSVNVYVTIRVFHVCLEGLFTEVSVRSG